MPDHKERATRHRQYTETRLITKPEKRVHSKKPQGIIPLHTKYKIPVSGVEWCSVETIDVSIGHWPYPQCARWAAGLLVNLL